MKVTVVGSGNWGTAVARRIALNLKDDSENDNTVNMWVYEEEVMQFVCRYYIHVYVYMFMYIQECCCRYLLYWSFYFSVLPAYKFDDKLSSE